MDLTSYNLDHWLSLQPKTDLNFPYNGRVDYYKRYLGIKEFLDNSIHPHIVSITLATSKLDENIYLTDHGTDHINIVIQRLSKLINSNEFTLTPYEVYLLLVATQLHDTGHIKQGRVNHEKFSSQVIVDLDNLIGNETVEKRMIWKIADAHGGRTSDGKKDKIDELLPKDSILNFTVRPQLLAALLRFADELADDFTRASKYLLEQGKIEKQSEVFHYYASVLNSVEIDLNSHEVRINYSLDKEHIINHYGKPDNNGVKEVYLIDEIFERIFKMYLECLYCMRFVPSQLKIETIVAKIEFIEKNSFQEFRKPILIKLTERGYPKIAAKNVYQLCKDDLIENGAEINGEYLKNILT